MRRRLDEAKLVFEGEPCRRVSARMWEVMMVQSAAAEELMLDPRTFEAFLLEARSLVVDRTMRPTFSGCTSRMLRPALSKLPGVALRTQALSG